MLQPYETVTPRRGTVALPPSSTATPRRAASCVHPARAAPSRRDARRSSGTEIRFGSEGRWPRAASCCCATELVAQLRAHRVTRRLRAHVTRDRAMWHSGCESATGHGDTRTTSGKRLLSVLSLRKAADKCSQGLLARRQAESSKQERQASPRHRRAQGSAGLHQYCSSSRCRAPRSINRPEGGDRKHEQRTLERAQRHSWCHEWGKAACARHGEPARAGLRPHARRGCCGGKRLQPMAGRLCFCVRRVARSLYS